MFFVCDSGIEDTARSGMQKTSNTAQEKEERGRRGLTAA